MLDPNTMNHWSATPATPSERILVTLFGSDTAHYEFYEEPPFLASVEGVSLPSAIVAVISTLTYREQLVVLRHAAGLTSEEIGREFGVTRERIRQIEAKGYRKLRHPSRSRVLSAFLREHTHTDSRVASARRELYDQLRKGLPTLHKDLCLEFVNRITRDNLASAFKALREQDLRALSTVIIHSCRIVTTFTNCLLCDDVAIPGFDWCLSHINQRKRVALVVACQHCGKKFLRSPGAVIRGEHSYCSQTCFGLDHRGPRTTRAGLRVVRVTRPCLQCGASVSMTPYWSEHRPRVFCTLLCAGLAHRKVASQ